jgi:hypothetical protein
MTMTIRACRWGAHGHPSSRSSPSRGLRYEMAMTKLGDDHVHHTENRAVHMVMVIVFSSFRHIRNHKVPPLAAQVFRFEGAWHLCGMCRRGNSVRRHHIPAHRPAESNTLKLMYSHPPTCDDSVGRIGATALG